MPQPLSNPFVRQVTMIAPPEKVEKKHKSKKRKSSRRRRRSPSPADSQYSGSSAESSSAHSAGAVFREATDTRARTSQENLIRYARKHPGRLACATMQHWYQMASKHGLRHRYSKTAMPASASKFFLSCLQPKEGEVVKGNLREIEVLAHVMDALATNRVAEVADVVSQRMQACKLAEEDGGGARHSTRS